METQPSPIWQCTARTQTHNLLITSPKPLHYQATFVCHSIVMQAAPADVPRKGMGNIAGWG